MIIDFGKHRLSAERETLDQFREKNFTAATRYAMHLQIALILICTATKKGAGDSRMHSARPFVEFTSPAGPARQAAVVCSACF